MYLNNRKLSERTRVRWHNAHLAYKFVQQTIHDMPHEVEPELFDVIAGAHAATLRELQCGNRCISKGERKEAT